jgi:hypothetical protein
MDWPVGALVLNPCRPTVVNSLSTVSASMTSLTTKCFVGARLIGSERAAALQLENLSLCLEECSEHHNSPSDPARDTASVRVLTASFIKIRLTCDFTVSGEIFRVRALRLLEKP